MSAAVETDLEACAREPIHIPGAIQPHGALLVVRPDDFAILQASANASSVIGAPARPGMALADAAPAVEAELRGWNDAEEGAYQQILDVNGEPRHVVAHRAGDALIVEFELLPATGEHTMDRIFPRLRRFAENLSSADDLGELAQSLAVHVRELTGFDRVLVYQFDPDWNGHVIAEDGNDVLPSYLDLRFPAGDIPAQARQLYRLNRVRIIPDVDYAPVPILPELHPSSRTPVDLSFALLRSVSPVHLEYMRNMGTAASMSVSVLVNGELWGLVSCHSREPHGVSLNIRNACDFAVQAVATQIAARQRAQEAADRVALGEVQRRLLARMTAAADWRAGLVEGAEDLLAHARAAGAAIVFDEELRPIGSCPGEAEVRSIVEWLERSGESEVFATDNLARRFPAAAGFADQASGILAIRISELHASWILWFRPEIVRTVTWGGDPHKVVREAGRIHPRNSFQAWKEQVRLHAPPWRHAEVAAARDLRGAVIGIVLRKAEELADLTQELRRSNKELEAFSYSVSHDLRAPFRHIVGYSELLREREKNLDGKSRHYLESIAESAVSAGRLVDDLLNFSHLGRTALAASNVNMNKLVDEVRRSLAMTIGKRAIAWKVEQLPNAWGDPTLLRQVWLNLVENAVKYTRPRPEATIEISGWQEGDRTVYAVRDNGVGFDMAYVGKLFGVFQRLQRVEDFEGTGIGLALTRRVIERHHGRVWAEGKVDGGATFTFTLPVRDKGASNTHA